MMVNQSSHQNYLLICEIGPIHEFTRQSRKTVDFWGASFIFSYIMADVAKKLKEVHGAIIFLPNLSDNPMVKQDGTPIHCGSVPDQLYILFDETKRNKIEEFLKNVIKESVDKIASAIESFFIVKNKNVFTNRAEIETFFNFFYIINEIKGTTPSYEEFIEAERRIKMRAAFKPFNQNTSRDEIKKWEKCNLCGDKKMVLTIPIDTDSGLFNEERICGVCLLKRYLSVVTKQLVDQKMLTTKYHSTSDIAVIPIEDEYKNLIENTSLTEKFKGDLKASYNALQKEFESKLEGIEKNDSGDGRRFFDTTLTLLNDFRGKFRDCEKALSQDKLPWLESPFYAIVYMDGDNLGNILKAKRDNFPGYLDEVSKTISAFSNSIYDIISGYQGQLIFAGGEDINFIIHPEHLLECIDMLRNHYNNLFVSNSVTVPMKYMFTLTAGAIVCYHKYPLSQAIMKAGEMMHVAKRHPGKNATALLLIKGHTETFRFTIPNHQISDLLALKGYFLNADISRTTPYRIEESKELLDVITDTETRKNYLKMILKGTRGKEHTNKQIESFALTLMKFGDIDTMINALLYARFLAGDK